MRETKSQKPKDQIVVGGLAPPRKQSGAGDEPAVASSIRLMAERLGLKNIEIRKHESGVTVLEHEIGLEQRNPYSSNEPGDRDALLSIHEQLRAALVSRQALDHDVLNRVRGTHAIRRRRDADWYAIAVSMYQRSR